MCTYEIEDHIRLILGDSVNISSNHYPTEYPTFHEYSCVRGFAASNGMFEVKILDVKISIEDTIGIGTGISPSPAFTVYATNTAAKMPSRGNHPRTPIGAYMWVVFGVVDTQFSRSFYQYSSIKSGFMLEISVVKNSGMLQFQVYLRVRTVAKRHQ